MEWLLAQTIEAAVSAKVIKQHSLDKVIVDESTVQEKAIAYPTDSKLLNRGRQQLVQLVAESGITLRQNYNRIAPKAGQIARYAHAKQYRCMRSHLKKLKTLVGRVWRDVFRQLTQVPQHLKPKVTDLLQKVERLLLKQQPQDSHKLYSLHAPEVECISKGKLRQPYEFGVKVSVMTTHKEDWWLACAACRAILTMGTPYTWLWSRRQS